MRTVHFSKKGKKVTMLRSYLNNIPFFILLVSILIAKPYRGGELRTIDTYRYGRYEVRMKSAAGSGVVSSFFTYRDFWSDGLSGSQHWNEIDLEWLGNHDDKVQTNLIIQNGWDLPELVNLDINPHEDFHTYAFEWTPDYVAFFVDEQMIRWVDNFYADSLYHYQKIMMNIWQPTWVDWVGEFDSDILPVYAFYDWVKYYAYVYGSGNTGTDNNFILLWEDDFDSWNTARWQKATHTFDNNNVDFIEENVVFQYGHMILCMTTPSNTGYNGDPLDIELNGVPGSISVGNAYPNPFNHNVVVPISLEQPGNVHFSVYDIRGNLITSGLNRFLDGGKKNIRWNGTNQDGKSVSAGTYFLRVRNKNLSKTKKIVYLK